MLLILSFVPGFAVIILEGPPEFQDLNLRPCQRPDKKIDFFGNYGTFLYSGDFNNL